MSLAHSTEHVQGRTGHRPWLHCFANKIGVNVYHVLVVALVVPYADKYKQDIYIMFLLWLLVPYADKYKQDIYIMSLLFLMLIVPPFNKYTDLRSRAVCSDPYSWILACCLICFAAFFLKTYIF